jgi:superfamily I DNA/RNA helicase
MSTAEVDDYKVWGPPGCGKTHEGQRWLLERIEEDKADPRRVAFVSYTNAAVDVAVERVSQQFRIEAQDIPYSATLHALCKRVMGVQGDWLADDHLIDFANAYGWELKVKRGSVSADDGNLDELAEKKGRDSICLQIWDFGRQRLINDPAEAYLAFAQYDIEAARRINQPHFCAFVRDYEHWKNINFLRDYTDLLTEYLENPFALPISVAVLDEAQDCSPLLWEVWNRLTAEAEYRACLADDDQCQPVGTLVLTSGGYKQIEELDPDSDWVAAWDRKDGAKLAGYPFAITRRAFSGELTKVTAGDSVSRYTPNHICLARWADAAKDPDATVVYLMRQGKRWRIGWCQLIRSDGIFHPGARARMERADALWILRVCANKREASIFESVYSARFGIPTVLFEPANGTQHYDREAIDLIFRNLGDLTENAIACLRSFGRDIRYPFYTPEWAQKRRGGSATFEVRACNLLTGYMAFPVHQAGNRCAWTPISLEWEGYTGWVYSLDVPRFHTYIADGIATHNCIYSYGGATPQLFNNRKARVANKLRQSYRLPRRITRLALDVIGQNTNREPKEILPCDREGAVHRINALDDLPLLNDERWFLLVRNWRLLSQYVSELEYLGVPYRIGGGRYSPWVDRGPYRSAQALVRLAGGEEITRDELRTLTKRLRAGRSLADLDAPISYGSKKKIDDWAKQDGGAPLNITGLAGLGWFNVSGVKRILQKDWSLLELECSDRDRFAYAQADGRGNFEKRSLVQLGSIHGHKGAEAENVVVLEGCAGATDRAMRDHYRREEEIRVAYVAATRAKENLYLLRPRFEPGIFEWDLING